MATRYFMIFGSPGSWDYLGAPVRSGHHSGWIEVENPRWTEPRVNGQPAHRLTVDVGQSLEQPPVFLRLRMHERFDLVVIDAWDDSAQKSQGTTELRGVWIIDVSSQAYSPVDTFTFDYESSKRSPGPGAAFGPGQTKAALVGAARGAAGAARK